MKVLLVVPALALLQLVCPGSVRSVPINITTMLKEMYDMLSSNATIPGVRVDRFDHLPVLFYL